jgi:hypothetical protein
MTPRNGLFVAFIGLVMAVPCFAGLLLLGNWNPDADDGLTIENLGLVCLALGAMLGLIVIAVGLIVAGVLAFTKQAANPYRHAATTYSVPRTTNQGSARRSNVPPSDQADSDMR